MKEDFKNVAIRVLLLCIFSVILNLMTFNIKPQASEVNGKYPFSIEDNLIEGILKNREDLFGEVLKNSEKHEIQILYTQINRDENNNPYFKSFKYNVDKDKYFYPASSVKLSACALALEKLNNINIDSKATLTIQKGRDSQSAVRVDYSSPNKKPSIENYIKKVLIASDNDGFDRLYEFLGQEYYNETLWKKGYKDTLIVHRLGNPMGYEENKYTNPFTFYNDDKVIYDQAMAYNSNNYSLKLNGLNKGKGYYSGKNFINSPKDFSKSNYFSMECLQGILKAIVFPKSIPEEQKFNLKEEDYALLKQYMSMLPKQCDSPKYNYKDSHVKYFIFGDSSKPIPENIKIYNKIGCAYGYLIDNAYIVDNEKGIEFMLTSVIYTNENDILNDGKYEYYKIGMPFLANLGREIYSFEERGRKI